MVYQGTIRGGVVILEPGTQLPDGLTVTVQPVTEQGLRPAPVSFPGSIRNGVPIFTSDADACAPGLEIVNQLRDEAS